ncbi:lamin tail domain-containing protein [Candidatus Parcubacteria bacterium]|nr:lamin tail domain-containing protein [Patescibacteria group bacterium]MBU4309925.1 lamin tail domain-containing protein [Patescibacteria group bacterium]MBU4432072.1 lamin tail domain-containing protein [Patescibacteria group bacterium]MBU4577850.1 lamin tail domain-containing protein [Patescibacteria group bacterium]MCG2696911.1 lamin tail domain-containing protein [Candidatus Parcubacteria bacterium]
MKKRLIILGIVVLTVLQLKRGAFVFANNNLQFSEIAWMGTATSSNDEWIELKNNYNETIDLNGWKIIARDGVPIINLTGSIIPGGFYLLERTDDDTVVDIPADLLYSGALVDTGEFLELWNSTGEVIDTVDALAGWPAGDKITKQTMDWDGSNWVMSVSAGGTPKAERAAVIVEPVPAVVSQVEYNNAPLIANNDADDLVVVKRYLLGDVVVNEFVSDPSAGEDEWVELFNNTDQVIDLSGWTITEGSGKETVLSGSILKHKYFVVEKIKGNLNNDGDVIVLRDAGKNLVDKVAYGNWDDGQAKDNAPAAKDPKSAARKIDGYNSYNNKFDFVKTDQPSKNAGNIILNEVLQSVINEIASSTATTTASSSQIKIDNLIIATTTVATTTKKNLEIKINEILPSPDKGGEEWIELYNDSTTKINLFNWSVDDDDQGGSKPYKFATTTWIGPKEFYILKGTVSKLALNNDGDKVILIDDNGGIVDKIIYEKTVVGQAYARNDEGQWLWTMVVTPGEKNNLMQKEIILAEQEFSTVQGDDMVLDIPLMISLEEARKMEKGAYILVEGTVTVLPGVLGSQYFYIGINQKTSDGVVNFGLQIYSNKKDFPVLKVGDNVEVLGEISETNGEKRLKTSSEKDIHIIGRGKTVIPQKMTCENIDDSLFGVLVEVDGEISDIKSTGIYLDDGTDEMRVYVKKTTGIDYKEYKEASKIRVIGIVGSAKSELRLLPRSKDDIIILDKKMAVDTVKNTSLEPKVLGATLDNSDLVIEPRAGNEAIKYLVVLLGGGMLMSLVWFFKFRKI